MDKTTNQLLNDVRVASPCAENWNEMSGSDSVRSCEQCQKKVYNLSEMTATEAAEFVSQSEGRVCVRFYRRADGTMITRDRAVAAQTAPITPTTLWGHARRAGAIGLTMASAASLAVAAPPRPDRVTMGRIGRPVAAVRANVTTPHDATPSTSSPHAPHATTAVKPTPKSHTTHQPQAAPSAPTRHKPSEVTPTPAPIGQPLAPATPAAKTTKKVSEPTKPESGHVATMGILSVSRPNSTVPAPAAIHQDEKLPVGNLSLPTDKPTVINVPADVPTPQASPLAAPIEKDDRKP